MHNKINLSSDAVASMEKKREILKVYSFVDFPAKCVVFITAAGKNGDGYRIWSIDAWSKSLLNGWLQRMKKIKYMWIW